jgi:hypothetical protein
MTLVGCSSTKPEIKYVPKIERITIPAPKMLTQECDIPKREGNRVVDYIVSERRLYNALEICNLYIRERNNNERQNN